MSDTVFSLESSTQYFEVYKLMPIEDCGNKVFFHDSVTFDYQGDGFINSTVNGMPAYVVLSTSWPSYVCTNEFFNFCESQWSILSTNGKVNIVPDFGKHNCWFRGACICMIEKLSGLSRQDFIMKYHCKFTDSPASVTISRISDEKIARQKKRKENSDSIRIYFDSIGMVITEKYPVLKVSGCNKIANRKALLQLKDMLEIADAAILRKTTYQIDMAGVQKYIETKLVD